MTPAELHGVEAWAGDAYQQGWISTSAYERIEQALSIRSGDELFVKVERRPLVAAFFGGTGVGKSSLLNRLANAPVARTGVIRPTSREVTVYVHDSVLLNRLPDHLPTQQAQIARHGAEAFREILWLDTPDIDSAEQSNRTLALAWLPHVDVVVYVVSPERYRDEKAWRVLRAEGQSHAWLFVMNQADRGHPEQIQDFRTVLRRAGFSEPLIFETCCVPPAESDQFESLKQALESLMQAHSHGDLAMHGQRLRRKSVMLALQAALAEMSAELRSLDQLKASWAAEWQVCREDLQMGLEWPMHRIAEDAAGRAKPKRPSAKRPGGSTPNESSPTLGVRDSLWDDWADTRCRDAVDGLVVAALEAGFPANRIRTAIEAELDALPRQITNIMELTLRYSLLRPGNNLQRGALRVARLLLVVLPVASVSWVTYAAVEAFRLSVASQGPYLGVEFIVHSLALVGLSWLLPFTFYRALRPSQEKAALRGLKQGFSKALAAIEVRIFSVIEDLEAQRKQLLAVGENLLVTMREFANESGGKQENSLLERVLPRAGVDA